MRPLGFWDQDADDVTGEIQGVVRGTDWTGPLLPAVGFGGTVQLVLEPEVSVAGCTGHDEHRLGRRHFGAIVGGERWEWHDGSVDRVGGGQPTQPQSPRTASAVGGVVTESPIVAHGCVRNLHSSDFR
jgi:hypothetical protein